MNIAVNPDSTTTQSGYTDSKRKLWLLGIAVPNIVNSVLLAYHVSPKALRNIFIFSGPIIIHGVIPAIDKAMGQDPDNPPEDVIASLENDPYYQKVVKLFLPFQFTTNLYGCYLATKKDTPFLHRVLIGHALGMMNGIGVNTAHELSHKPSKIDHYMSHFCLLPTGYNHFRIEHPYGHHRRVATPEDPASSQLGETFWQFWPRTVVGSFKSAIEIETRRLERKGKGFWVLENELIQGWAMSAAYHALMIKLFGRRVIPVQIVQALCGITLFEIVNYMEHYGLKRATNANGKYVRTLPEHSWNNNSLFSNILLYQLQRHSDHHAFPTRSFQSLRHYENVPQLPAGYASMLLPAMIPKWWFKLMDERVINHYDGDIDKLNVYPKARKKLLTKYANLFKEKIKPAGLLH